MKNKLSLVFSICLMVCILFCTAGVSASDNDVEITFAVGDSTLSVNGEDVTVTTPYVVNGTTLVPVRVITEAFGAEVLWNEAEQSVAINYSDVVIKLAIDNKTAYVNDVAIELLAAPELKNSTTMLPLRFITESFGADVTYDEATEKITVIKKMTESNSIKDYSLILKRSDKKMVGDSFLNWSMEYSPELMLAYRSFNGEENVFMNDDETTAIAISISEFEEEQTIDDVYMTASEAIKQYSVSKFEKGKTPSGVEYVIAHFTSSTDFVEQRVYLKGKKGIIVIAQIPNSENREKFESLTDITATFDLVFDAEKTEDLSDVKEESGTRTYKSDYFAIEMDVPGYLYLSEYENKENRVDFYGRNESNAISFIGLSLYSSMDGHTAKTWAEEDLKHNKKVLNEKYATFSEIEEITIEDKAAYIYEYEVKQKEKTEITYDLFIDAGDYFYNISVTGEKSETKKIKDDIFKSIVLKKLDSEKTGTLIRTDNLNEIKYKDYEMKSAGIKLKVPGAWVKMAEDSTNLGFIDQTELRSVLVTVQNKSSNDRTGLKYLANEMYKSSKSMKTAEMLISAPKSIKIGTVQGYTYDFVNELDNTDVYYQVYIFENKQRFIFVILDVPDIGYGDECEEIFNTIINSLEIK